MKSFVYEGIKYINGYACNSLGKPITVKNGYSSADEKEAHQAYLEALESMTANSINLPKYKSKFKFEQTTDEELWAMVEKEYHQNKGFSEDGYMLNDSGEKISIENGYTDADENFTKRQVKNFHL